MSDEIDPEVVNEVRDMLDAGINLVSQGMHITQTDILEEMSDELTAELERIGYDE
ncbi:hypothetical protein HUG10_20605 (plasmid) [Halorarum halophilum]|uniref:Uncharacterized protein n=1 Tax=Halorarum halophilum TaxID=2743090 RepID=A0A7D5GIL8_9EURY|nr:hypothetical protein [Halobaculum halophilum]QLG30010.1 hypothetical protein HUG10_20605 [Halobaculum halophilum]